MFLITANSRPELENIIQAAPKGVILAAENLSLRQKAFLDEQQLADTVRKLKEKNIEIYINAMKMVMERDLPQAEALMKLVRDLDIDGVYIADEAYIPLAEKYGQKNKLIYQPETLIVNGLDANFYLDQGLKAISLAHELSLEEIQELADTVKEPEKLEVLVQGRYSWMYSGRKLVSNYLKEIESGYTPKEDEVLYLEETGRPGKYMPVEEGDYGTVVWSVEPIQSVRQMQALADAGIGRFRIDTRFEDENYGPKQLELYKSALNGTADLSQAAGSDSLYGQKTTLRKEKAEKAGKTE